MTSPPDQTGQRNSFKVLAWGWWSVQALSVGTLGTIVIVIGAIWAFCVGLVLNIDDLGLFNPVYMYLETGKMSYPAYGFPEAMVVHPPTHYLVLALLIKAGIPITYVGSVPPFLLLVLTVILLGRSRLSDWIKIGFMFGFLYGAVSLAWAFGPATFGIRPDSHLAFAWFAGLVALETGRIDGWNCFRLGLGAFLLSYASGLHYPASLAWTGVLVYASWALYELGWRSSRPPLVSLTVGGCLFGIPYLALFVLPHLEAITNFISSVEATGGLRSSWREHVEIYRVLSLQLSDDAFQTAFFWPLSRGVPVALICTPLLLLLRQTRALSAASLGFTGPLLLGVQRKLGGYYFYPELMLYASAQATFLAIGLGWLIRTGRPQRERLAVILAVTGLVGLLGMTMLRAGILDIRLGRVDEMQIARAAGRRILGPNAMVGARLTRFYTNGGSIHYRIEPEVLWNRTPPVDLKGFFREFDAIAEDSFSSELTNNQAGESLSSWYANGTLQLRGFYFSTFSTHVSYLLLHPDSIVEVRGYALLPTRQVAQFAYDRSGQYVFVAAVCPTGRFSSAGSALLGHNTHLLPHRGKQGRGDELHAFVTTRDGMDRFRRALVDCRLRDELPLKTEYISVEQLLASLEGDRVIQFPQSLAEAIRLRYGRAVEVSVGSDGWPVAFAHSPRRREAQTYLLGDENVRILARLDAVTSQDLQVNRYGRGGGLEGKPDCLRKGDSCGRYEAGTSKDHLATAFYEVRGVTGQPLLFSVWVKPIGGPPPSVALQDDGFYEVGAATPVISRPDGWMLYAGVSEQRNPGRVRLLIIQSPGMASLLDKLLVAEAQKPVPAAR
jgi:hypothetical protein